MPSPAPTPANPGLRRLVRAAIATMTLTGAAAAWGADGTVLVASGRVEVIRGNAASPVVSGAEVNAGDLVRTGEDGRLQIRFSDGAIVSLQPRSEFRIDQYQFDTGSQRGVFSLLRGALRTASGAIGKRNRDDYRMQTPTATVGIRGTEYALEETVCDPACYPGPRAGTRVSVSAGRIVFGNPAGQIEVAAGQAAAIDGPSSAPRLSSERPVLAPRSMTSTATQVAAGPTAGATLTNDDKTGVGSGPNVIDPIAAATSAGAATTPGTPSSGGDESAAPRTADPGAVEPATLTDVAKGSTSTGDAAARIDTAAVSATDSGAIAIADPGALGGAARPSGAAATARPPSPTTDRRTTGHDADPASAVGTDPASGADPGGTVASNDVTWPQWVRSAGTEPTTASTRRNTAGMFAKSGTTTGDGSVPGPSSPTADTLERDPAITSPSTDDFTGSATQLTISTPVATTFGLTDRFIDPTALVSQPSKQDGSAGGEPSTGGPGSGPLVNGSGSSGSGSSGSGSSGSGSSGNGSSGSGTTLVSGWNETGGLHVRAQEIPLLPDLSFVASASSLHLDDQLRLDAIGNCSGLACLSRGSTRFGNDTGHDAYASWGRWTDGEAHVRSFGVTWMRLPLSENQGIHYLIGAPTVSMPTSGTFSYGIVGATQPTISDGSTGPGTFVAAAVVQFASGTNTKIGLQGTVAMPTGTMTFATTGGTTNPQSSNLQMTSPNTFSGQLATQAGGASPLSCGSSGCRTTVTGGFFGPQAARLGFGYSISGDTGQRTIGGVGVLTR